MRKFNLTLFTRHPGYKTLEFPGIRLGDAHRKAALALQDVTDPHKCLAMVDDVVASWRKAKPNCEAIGLSGSNPDFACEIRRLYGGAAQPQ